MRKLLLILLFGLNQFAVLAQDDPSAQDAQTEPAEQVDTESTEDAQDDGSDLVAVEILEVGEDESESSVRFIPTEEISQDLGVSFPINI